MAEIALILPSGLSIVLMATLLVFRLRIRPYFLAIIPLVSIGLTWLIYNIAFTSIELGPFFGVTLAASYFPAVIVCMGMGFKHLNSPHR